MKKILTLFCLSTCIFFCDGFAEEEKMNPPKFGYFFNIDQKAKIKKILIMPALYKLQDKVYLGAQGAGVIDDPKIISLLIEQLEEAFEANNLMLEPEVYQMYVLYEDKPYTDQDVYKIYVQDGKVNLYKKLGNKEVNVGVPLKAAELIIQSIIITHSQENRTEP